MCAEAGGGVRVIVCGGRNFADSARVDQILSAWEITELCEGGHRHQRPDGSIDWSRSADALARRWANNNGIDGPTIRADWPTLGKKAGPIRNQRMLDEFQPDAVIAFPGGDGTADMVRRALKATVPVIEVTA